MRFLMLVLPQLRLVPLSLTDVRFNDVFDNLTYPG